MNVQQDSVVTDSEFYEINLGDQFLGPDLSDFVVEIQGTEYDGVPINKDMFPVHVNGASYNGHLRYSKDDVELLVIKNGEGPMQPNDGIVRYSIEGLDSSYADSLVLYIIGILRKV